jgi:hypothetical protein
MSPDTHIHTHPHTSHTNATPHMAGGKEFEWTKMLRPLDFLPPGFVDLPRHANTHTHTHTHANAPWLTCAMENFVCNASIADPTSPHDREWWLTWDFCSCYGTARFDRVLNIATPARTVKVGLHRPSICSDFCIACLSNISFKISARFSKYGKFWGLILRSAMCLRAANLTA